MRRAAMGCLTFLSALALPLAATADSAEFVLYPSILTRDERSGEWHGEIRGKVLEREHGPAALVTRATLRAALGLFTDGGPDDERIFRARSAEFEVDYERGQRVRVAIGDRSFLSRRSRANGDFRVEIVLAEGVAGGLVPFRARLEADDPRELTGTLRLVGPAGVSVISDIDDTVKESNVLDRGELVANTFVRPYRAVRGMPELYRAWGEQDVAVHYVTASPWQLFAPLWGFLSDSGFPGVEIQMRDLRLVDLSVVDFFRDAQDYKTERIREILRRFPERTFVLIGDTGEQDPQIYAALAREFPARVRGIFLRAVRAEHLDRARQHQAFAGVEESCWLVFDDPATLPRDLAAWLGAKR